MKYMYFFAAIMSGVILNAQQQPLAVVPFALEHSGIYIYARVNQTDSVKFLFDTGANGSVIDEEDAERLGVISDGESWNIGSNGAGMVKRSSSNQWVLKNIVLDHTPFTLIPYYEATIDGVIGTDIMKNYIIEIDYDAREMRWYTSTGERKKYAGFHALRLYFPGDYLSVKSSFTCLGRVYKGFFGLDTGADNVFTIASPFVKRHALQKKLVQTGTATSKGSDGSVYESPIVQIPEVLLATMHFYNLPADLSMSVNGGDAVTDKVGFYGNDLLKRFHIVLDIPHGYIYFKPNELLYTPFFGE